MNIIAVEILLNDIKISIIETFCENFVLRLSAIL